MNTSVGEPGGGGTQETQWRRKVVRWLKTPGRRRVAFITGTVLPILGFLGINSIFDIRPDGWWPSRDSGETAGSPAATDAARTRAEAVHACMEQHNLTKEQNTIEEERTPDEYD